MNSLFEDLIQNVPAIFYRCASDENWTMHFLNNAILKLSGYEASDFIANEVRTFSSIIHSDDIEEAFRIVNAAIDHHESWSVEYRIVDLEGSLKWVTETGIGIYSASGDLEYLDGFIIDISERKRLMADVVETRKSLRDSENFFHALTQSAVDPIIVISQLGLIEEFNEAAERVFGYQSEEVVGQNVSILTPHEHAVKHDGYLQSYLETGEAKIIGIGREVQGKRKDDSLFPMQLSISEIETADGGSYFAGIVRDLTEEKRLEGELLKAHKMEAVGQLAAGIAHEINTPIQFIGDNLHFLADSFKELSEVVKLSAQFVDKTESGECTETLFQKLSEQMNGADLQYLLEDIPESLSESSDGVSRISEIVKAMKEFSHPGGKKKEAADLEGMIESTLVVARNEWKYAADVETEFESGLPEVDCFPGEINQVLLNIIVNAAHAIESKQTTDGQTDKGTIKIKAFKEGRFVVVAISDTGCGIKKQHVNKVFDPFFTTKDVGKGTGQGLSMAYATIVGKHKGKLSVESVLGEGTTMRIKLPIS